jgi:hypothetical protein
MTSVLLLVVSRYKGEVDLSEEEVKFIKLWGMKVLLGFH